MARDSGELAAGWRRGTVRLVYDEARLVDFPAPPAQLPGTADPSEDGEDAAEPETGGEGVDGATSPNQS